MNSHQENSPLRLGIVAAEISADIQAAAVIRELKSYNSNIEFFGSAGSRSEAEGMELFYNPMDLGSVGIFESLGRLPKLVKIFKNFSQQLIEAKPDCVVLIDAPAVNMRLCKILRAHGIRTVYYFPPSAWTTKPERLRQIHDSVDAVVTAFSRNYVQYMKEELPVAYYGHPFVDIFKPLGGKDRALEQLGFPKKQYLGVLPGSRRHEINTLLPRFLKIAQRTRESKPDLEVIIPVAAPELMPLIEKLTAPYQDWVHLVMGEASHCIEACDAILTASGSVTLQIAFMNVPMVIAYVVSSLDYTVGYVLLTLNFIQIKNIGLPNLVLNDFGVPEYFQDTVNARNIAPLLIQLLDDTPQRKQQLDYLKIVRDSLGRPGVTKRVSGFIHSFAQGCSLEEALVRNPSIKVAPHIWNMNFM